MPKPWKLAALTAVIALSIAARSEARPRIGLEAGINAGWFDYDQKLFVWEDSKAHMFPVAGAVIQFPLGSRFALRSGLRLVEKGTHVDINWSDPDVGVHVYGDIWFHQRYLALPLEVEFRPGAARLSASIGGEFGYLLEARSDMNLWSDPYGITHTSDDVTDDLERTEVAAVAGVRLAFPLGTHEGTIRTRYTHGLVGVAKPDTWVSDWKTRGVETLFGVTW